MPRPNGNEYGTASRADLAIAKAQHATDNPRVSDARRNELWEDARQERKLENEIQARQDY